MSMFCGGFISKIEVGDFEVTKLVSLKIFFKLIQQYVTVMRNANERGRLCISDAAAAQTVYRHFYDHIRLNLTVYSVRSVRLTCV